MNKGRKRAVSFTLAILVTASCMFCMGISTRGKQESAAANDDSYIYVPTNLYKYNRAGSNKSVENMAINKATQSAALAKSGNNTEIRALYFDKPSLQYSGDWSQYHDTGAALRAGFVKNKLDTNGNLQWNSGYENGRSYQYVAADLFRSEGEDTPDYRQDFTDLSFPLKKEKDADNGKFTGYYSFDSAKQRAILDQTNKNINIEEPQTIPGSHAQYSPFYSGRTDENSLNRYQDQQYSFGMDMHMQFTAPKDGKVYNPSTGNYDDMQFSFSGDDDVWIFVDGNLVLDLGGIHQQLMGSIDFANGTYSVWDYNKKSNGQEIVPDEWEVPTASANYYHNNDKNSNIKLNTKSSAPHTLTVYYLERGAGMSNFRMRCNLFQSSSFEVGKQLVGKTASGDNGNYTFQVCSSKSGSSPVPITNQPFEIYNVGGGTYVGPGSTDEKGNLSLKAGQKAVFRYHVEGSSPDASSFAGQTITFTETGKNANQYDTTWQTTAGSSVTSGNGKKAVIMAPPDTDSVQTASAVFTNELPTDITSPLKTAVQTSSEQRTYDITLKTSTVNNSTDAVFTPILASVAISKTDYYLNASKDHKIWKESNDCWYDSTGKLIQQPTTVYHLDADAQTTQPITGATVQDTIDPRFEVVDGDGNVLDNNDTITTSQGVQATLHVPQSGPAYLEWTNQTIPVDSSQWKQTIHIKAKGEFIGGNDIPTNVAESSYVSFTQNGKTITKLFNQPTVNVPIWFSVENTTQTIFLGDQTPSVTLEPYTLKDDETTKVMGNGIFCGMGETGTFDFYWVNDADGKKLSGANDKTFPAGLAPSDTSDYHLHVTFTPSGSGTASQSTDGGDLAVVTTAQGKYTINVVKGELDLTKIMDAQYPAPKIVNPRQSFVFRITRSDSQTKQIAETFYEVITPDQIDIGKTQKITGLKKGIYTVTEETGETTAAWRYSATPEIKDNDAYGGTNSDGIVYIGRDTSTESTKAYTGAETGNGFVTANPASVEFTNHLSNSQWAGDTTVAVNTINP